MKNSLIKIGIAISTVTMGYTGLATASDSHMKVVGTVQELVCGEMDPIVLGDVCVLFVANLSATKTFGLVLDFDSGTQNSKVFDKMRRSGQVLAVGHEGLEKLSLEETAVLEEYRGGVNYLRYTGAVEDLLE